MLPLFPSTVNAAAESLQSYLTLCNPTDGSPPGSLVPGILQARTLEWVAISFFNARKWKVKVKSISPVQLLPTPWTAASPGSSVHGFSRQEYWSGLPLPSPTMCYIRIWSYSVIIIHFNIDSYLISFTDIFQAIIKWKLSLLPDHSWWISVNY